MSIPVCSIFPLQTFKTSEIKVRMQYTSTKHSHSSQIFERISHSSQEIYLMSQVLGFFFFH